MEVGYCWFSLFGRKRNCQIDVKLTIFFASEYRRLSYDVVTRDAMHGEGDVKVI